MVGPTTYSYMPRNEMKSQGAIKLLHFPFTLGCPTIIMPQFDPAKFCAHIERFKITIALVVPPVLVALARHPGALCDLGRPVSYLCPCGSGR